MLGSQLKFLAEVADLARLDFEAAAITLVNHEGRLVSRYQGAYSSGQRWLDIPDAPMISLAVSAMQFKSLASLFDPDEEVIVTEISKGLNLKSNRFKIDLNAHGQPEGIEPYEPIEQNYVIAPVPTLLRELECASEFSARSMARPVLTGLRISGQDGKLDVQSSDGISSLFETVIDVEGDSSIDMVVPAYDLVLGLRLLDSGMAKLMKTTTPANRVALYGQSAIFQSSILTGTWPEFAKIRQERKRQEVKISTAFIRSLVQSVRILGTSNDLRLRGDGEFLYLETIEGESGRFEAKIESDVQGTYTFDVGSFLLAQGLGSELQFKLPNEGGVPTLVESGTRKYWIAAKL